LLDGEFGLRDVCLSVPCLVSGQGVARIIESTLPEREQAALFASAAVLQEATKELGLAK
jgi:L-lactate dehydrogenase